MCGSTAFFDLWSACLDRSWCTFENCSWRCLHGLKFLFYGTARFCPIIFLGWLAACLCLTVQFQVLSVAIPLYAFCHSRPTFELRFCDLLPFCFSFCSGCCFPQCPIIFFGELAACLCARCNLHSCLDWRCYVFSFSWPLSSATIIWRPMKRRRKLACTVRGFVFLFVP